jgi:hypothetical protein
MPLTLNGTTGIAGANGSASTPAVQGEDTNTGVFFPAADTVAVATGGSERMRVDSSGRLGIGTNSPNQLVHVSGGNIRVSSASENTIITNGGNFTTGAVTDSAILYGSGSLLFGNGSTERARIDSSGNLLVGTTSWAAGQNAFRVNGPGAGGGRVDISRNTTAAADQVYFANPNGVIGAITTNGTTTSYVSSSDYRLKENVQPMQDALAKIAQLNPVTYTWKVDGSDGQGFIAHELQAVVPDCVTGEKDAVDAEGNPQYQGVDTSFLVATLVAAIKEQQATIDALVARVSALEAI